MSRNKGHGSGAREGERVRSGREPSKSPRDNRPEVRHCAGARGQPVVFGAATGTRKPGGGLDSWQEATGLVLSLGVGGRE